MSPKRKKTFALAIGLAATVLMLLPERLPPAPDDMPRLAADTLVRDDNLSSVARFTRTPEAIDFIYVIDADSSPVYVMKAKGSDTVTLVAMPVATHRSLEAEVLLPQAVPYRLADRAFVLHNFDALAPLVDIRKPSMLASFFAGVLDYAGLILMGALFFFMLRMMPKMAQAVRVIRPEHIDGDMDDLVGLEDIKAEVAHLKSMIDQRERYAAHGIDRPFNVMLSGPAGTGKTKLAGFIAKDLNVPIIYASGSNLETGYVGGGSATLKRIQSTAEQMGDCVIFLDEAQAILMQRGQSSQKWADDTPNTLLTLLDGLAPAPRAQLRFWRPRAATRKRVGIVWIVASNFNENSLQMDEAVLRRFPVKIGFRLPSHKERKLLIERLLRTKQAGCVRWDDIDLEQIAAITEGMSHALVTTVTETASRLAIEDDVPIDAAQLVRAFERVSIGLTDRETSAGRERDRERVAIHEMGHFVAHVSPALAQGLPIETVKAHSTFVKVSTEAVAQQGALGYMLSTRPETHLLSVADIEQRIVGLYGGLAAEEVFYGQRGVSLGAHDDIKKATEFLRQLIEKTSIYGRAKLDYSAFAESPREVMTQIEQKSAECYAQALAATEMHREFIAQLKDVLMTQYVLDREEIFAHLAAYVEAKRAA